MEVLKYTDILGKDTSRAIVEGRMVFLDAYGRDNLPHSAAQAALSRYLIAWPVENRSIPMYEPYPTYTRALRRGFDQAGNVPFTAAVRTWYPNLSDEPETIPSGNASLLYDEGEFIVTSGNWIWSAITQVGDELSVSYAAGTQGQLQRTLTAGGTSVAIVTGFPGPRSLQFRTYGD